MLEPVKKNGKYETGDKVYSSPAVANNIIYVGSKDGHLYALDAGTGEVKWDYETRERIISSPAVANEIVYVGSDDHYIYALDAGTGEEKWHTEQEIVSLRLQLLQTA